MVGISAGRSLALPRRLDPFPSGAFGNALDRKGLVARALGISMRDSKPLGGSEPRDRTVFRSSTRAGATRDSGALGGSEVRRRKVARAGVDSRAGSRARARVTLVSHPLGSSALHDSTRESRAVGASDPRDRKTLVSGAPRGSVLAPVRSSSPLAASAGATRFDEAGFDEVGFDEVGFDEAGLDSGDERSARGRTSCSSRSPMIKEPWGDDRKEVTRPRAPRSPRTRSSRTTPRFRRARRIRGKQRGERRRKSRWTSEAWDFPFRAAVRAAKECHCSARSNRNGTRSIRKSRAIRRGRVKREDRALSVWRGRALRPRRAASHDEAASRSSFPARPHACDHACFPARCARARVLPCPRA